MLDRGSSQRYAQKRLFINMTLVLPVLGLVNDHTGDFGESREHLASRY